MSFRTASAILRGRWLIDKAWTSEHLPLIMKLVQGESADFGSEREEIIEPQALTHKAGVVYNVGYGSDLSRLPSGSIAMVSITGPVTKYGDMCAYGSVDHVATINRLTNAPNVTGIILSVDSPGGEAAGTAMLADAIKAATKSKPVIGIVNDGIAASAAMWIISASNEIYTTQKTDMVGSIGVYTTIVDWYSYFKQQGLSVRDIYASQSTDKNLDYREALKGNDQLIKDELNALAGEFINTIRQNRAGKLTSDAWTTGKMFYTKEAIKIGLIDGQKTFDQVMRRMDTLIKEQQQSSNSNTMAFQKTLVAAKATQFDVIDGGFLLEEAHLNSIEATLSANETAVATANSEKTQLQTQLQTANQAVADANTNVQEKDARITALEVEVKDLKKQPVAAFSATTRADDPSQKTNKYETSIDKEVLDMREKLNIK